MSVKKPFVKLVDLLQANKNLKVEAILQQVLELCESKKKVGTVLKDAKGKVIAIFCYYHKQWEYLNEVEYGSKKHSTSGYNTMCKIGVSKWTKQQSNAKKANAELLNRIASKKEKPENIHKLMEEIEVIRLKINTADQPKGYKEPK